MKSVVVVLLTLLFGSASAQTLRTPHQLQHKQDLQAPYVIHYTDVALQRPQERADLARYHELVRSGEIEKYRQSAKKTYQIGDRKEFKVQNLAGGGFYTLVFKLRATGNRANVWVDSLAELNGQITSAHWDSLNVALNVRTPASSISAQKGIIQNDEEIFGLPPNIDGDGKVDALCYNIVDGYNPPTNSGYIAGYVTSADLAGGSSGNNTDIIHLDTYPQLSGSRGVEGLNATSAHEYQHWIMYKYDRSESSFINEGLSEYAEIMQGYTQRNISYYNIEQNVALTAWRATSGGNVADQTLRDYERAGFFTTYLAGQIGAQKTGTLTRNNKTAIPGLADMLSTQSTGLTVADLLLNFHTTVLLNNLTSDARFGFGIYNSRSNNRIASTQIPTYDGQAGEQTAAVTTPLILEGSAAYAKWNNVTDFQLTISVLKNGIASASYNSRAKVRAVILNEDNSYTFEEFTVPQTQKLFAGTKKSIWLVMANIEPIPSNAETFSFRYSASWRNLGQTILQNTVSYGTGTTVGQSTNSSGETSNLWFGLSSDANGKQALRVLPPALPAVGWTRSISKVSIANYYDNQFNGSIIPDTETRDFILTVWASGTDTDYPKEVLWSKVITDTRTYAPTTSATLIYQDIDLSAYENELNSLPSDSIFVGIQENGTDMNYMVIAPTPYTGANSAYVYLGPTDANPTRTWRELNAIGFSDGSTVRNMTLPIRVTFKLASPVANEPNEAPQNFEIHQNYPNPFSGRSTIQYTLKESGDVVLKLYDSLGREVRTLLSGKQEAGAYTIEFNAEGLASGLYFYTLSAGGNRQTHKMTLLQ